MVKRQDISDQQLVKQFVAGDEAAFDELVERYYGQIYAFLARFTGQTDLAEDLTQETFIKLHISADTFDPSRAFKPWLFAVAANKARDALRAAARGIKTVSLQARAGDDRPALADVLPGDQERPEIGLIRNETHEQVREAVQSLPEHLREVLTLAYYQHLQYKDIAEIVGIPVGTVKSRLHKAVMMFGKVWKSTKHDT